MWPLVRELRDEVCDSSGIKPPKGKRVTEMPEEQLKEWLNMWQVYVKLGMKKYYVKIADVYNEKFNRVHPWETIRNAIQELERLMIP